MYPCLWTPARSGSYVSSRDPVQTTQEDLPVTSYPCQWNVPRKRKESSAKIADVSFIKHVYGREKKHTLKPLYDFDPRPSIYHGTASDRMLNFLSSAKGKNIGVSVLFDPDTRVWADNTEELYTSLYTI